jgi:hypothetical protein
MAPVATFSARHSRGLPGSTKSLITFPGPMLRLGSNFDYTVRK